MGALAEQGGLRGGGGVRAGWGARPGCGGAARAGGAVRRVWGGAGKVFCFFFFTFSYYQIYLQWMSYILNGYTLKQNITQNKYILAWCINHYSLGVLLTTIFEVKFRITWKKWIRERK
jgi:hypothetical protein